MQQSERESGTVIINMSAGYDMKTNMTYFALYFGPSNVCCVNSLHSYP
jgi:hypothetical protein